MRAFIGENISIDGRMIPYQLVTASDYFYAKDYPETKIEGFYENKIYDIVSQIMGLKQSCYLLRHTSYSCQSLSDSLYLLKMRLIHELKDEYSFEFDDDFVENYQS